MANVVVGCNILWCAHWDLAICRSPDKFSRWPLYVCPWMVYHYRSHTQRQERARSSKISKNYAYNFTFSAYSINRVLQAFAILDGLRINFVHLLFPYGMMEWWYDDEDDDNEIERKKKYFRPNQLFILMQSVLSMRYIRGFICYQINWGRARKREVFFIIYLFLY